MKERVTDDSGQFDDRSKKQIALRKRLKDYGLRVLKLYDSLPRSGAVQIIAHQLARSATSPGAQYREACRAKSNADFISKIEGAIQELDESDYWLELLVDGGYVPAGRLDALIKETDELIAIFTSMVNKVKTRARDR
ncbi:MAG: four helix bundle protein [Pyrinomonadaceae bacterium]